MSPVSLFIIVTTQGGLIDTVDVRPCGDEAIRLADRLATGKDPETNDVRVFRLNVPGSPKEIAGAAEEYYTAPMSR